MRGSVGVERANDAEIVGVFRRTWEQVADVEAGFAVFGEAKGRLHELTDWSAIRSNRRFASIGRVVVLVESRLGVKRIDLAGTAVHEEEDDMFCLGGEVGRLRRKRVQETGVVRSCFVGKEARSRQ